MYHDVVMDGYWDALHKMALSLSHSMPGSSEYLQCYQKAVKIIVDGLSNADKSKYRVEAKKLTKERLLPQPQIWYVHTHHLPR
jgi:hypothetical protein